MIRSLICTAWFDLARTSLPRPLRPPVSEYQKTRRPIAEATGTKRKRDITDTGEQPDIQQLHLKLRMERKRFKNVRVHFTNLPETPRPRNSRSPTPNSEWGQTIAALLEDPRIFHRSAPVNHKRWAEDQKKDFDTMTQEILERFKYIH